MMLTMDILSDKTVISRQRHEMIAEWDEAEKLQMAKWLRSHLMMGEVCVKFTKTDGTLRTMRCTLKDVPEYVPKTDRAPRKKNDEVMAVFDLDENSWRSFRIDSIKEISFNVE